MSRTLCAFIARLFVQTYNRIGRSNRGQWFLASLCLTATNEATATTRVVVPLLFIRFTS